MGAGKFLLLFIILNTHNLWAEDSCNRTAIINNQKILVDINSTSKGEGLRPYLSKDPVAVSYLDTYQKNIIKRSATAIIGTLGAASIIGSVFIDDEKTGFLSREGLLASGAALIAINFLISRTLEHQNESNLQDSIEEYNKRNLPKIYFLPYKDRSALNTTQKSSGLGLFAGVNFGF